MGNDDSPELFLALTCFLWESDPVPTSTMLLNVVLELSVFFRRPRTFLHVCLVTTRSAPHDYATGAAPSGLFAFPPSDLLETSL